ncbi:unnamed protein product [Rotaria sp. Silwood1]|nr:unnamed protein product [Rotaria sp. Silwood1]CAF1483884.1 unnamed protein product [Rotaria sp. Silwood1]CAF3610383.1 unnamed protein product [Rotaria sp. Silwood1]CAF3628723.1 unnamed protein product [Rotaria sp. Silwood1]CAF4573268.1 unnamed protein product [Rotaria sp. Silwood1]
MSNNSTASTTCNGTTSNNYLSFSMSASMSIDTLSQKSLKWQVALQVIYVSLSTLQFITATICNLLTIETVLQKTIRITSLGVYLIVFSFASLIGMIMLYFRIIVTLFFNEELDKNSLIHCRIITTIFSSTLILCLWTGAFVSIERVLIQLYGYSLYRSRKYAILISVLLIFLTAAANITTFIGWQTAVHPIVPSMRLCKFRQFSAHWKLVDEITNSMYIHYVIPLILHVLSTVCVLIDIIRHKIILTDAKRCEWSKIMCQQLKKHKSFFIPPIVILVCTLPHALLTNLSGSITQHLCSKSNMNAYLRLHIAFYFLYYSLQTIGFFTYIYPSNVYMNRFHETWTARKSKAAIAALLRHHKFEYDLWSVK